MILSLIENAYEENPKFYIDTRINNRLGDQHRNFGIDIANVLSGVTHELDFAFRFSPQNVSYLLSRLLGFDDASDMPFMSSLKGQVGFFSFLDTLELGGGPIFRTQVFPGSLHLDGERFSYVEGEENTNLGDTLNIAGVSTKDFSIVPFPAVARSKECTWYCSLAENYLNIFYAPDLEKDFSIGPSLFMLASYGIVFLERCRRKCPSLEDFQPDLLYCRTVAATLSPNRAHIFRGFSSFGNSLELLFVELSLAHKRYGNDAKACLPLGVTTKKGFPDDRMVTIAQGSSCLACACQAGLDLLAEMKFGTSVHVIILE